MKKRKQEGIPETLQEWEARLTSYASNDAPSLASVPKQDAESRLREKIAGAGSNLKLDFFLHELHCPAGQGCCCDLRAVVILYRRYRKPSRHIVRLSR